MILLSMIAIGAFGLLMIYKPWREPEEEPKVCQPEEDDDWGWCDWIDDRR